ERVKQQGIDLQIIDGSKEAQIIYSSRIEQQLDSKKTYLFIDVGGGSTELSLFSDMKMVASRSFDIGTIRILDNQDKDETWDEMRHWVRSHTKPYKVVYGIGTGGN